MYVHSALNDLAKTTLYAVSHVAGSPEAVMAQKVVIDSKVAAMFKVLGEYKHHEVNGQYEGIHLADFTYIK
jgi:hypothetical protein